MFLDKSFIHRSYPKLAYGSIYPKKIEGSKFSDLSKKKLDLRIFVCRIKPWALPSQKLEHRYLLKQIAYKPKQITRIEDLKTSKRANFFSTTDICVRRLLKGQEPIFLFAFPIDQLLICFHDYYSLTIHKDRYN